MKIMTNAIRRTLQLIGMMMLSLYMLAACDGGGGSGPPNNLSKYTLHGVDLGPYKDSQDPNLGASVSEDQLHERMQGIADYTQWVRCFGSTHGLEKCGEIARELGLKTALSAWLGKNLAANEEEIANLIAVSKKGECDIGIVGSETLVRGDLTETQLIAYINRVKSESSCTIVTTADTYNELMSHQAVIDAVDIVFVNYFPYWEGIEINNAIGAIHQWHKQLKAAAGGREVVVSETGWPSCGNTIGSAIPSLENAAKYFLNFVSWARAEGVAYFYFEAYDEPWKAKYEGPQGACWGLWDKDGNLKQGMQDIFNDKTTPNNWSDPGIIGGEGDPEIKFTYVPPIGSFNNLKGQALHVVPKDYNVAVYIKVGYGWWTKPYFSSPLTIIQKDGSFTTDITTGGIDEKANTIAAYLIPSDYKPPAMSGGSTLPQELEDSAAAKVIITRS